MNPYTNGLPTNLGQTLSDIGDTLGIGNARREREFNALEAEKQRAWETEMSNTAYQRAVQDMEKAGINPAQVFANNGGSAAASTPSGASARSSAGGGSLASIVNSAANLTHAFNSDKNRANDIDHNKMVKVIANLGNLIK